MQHPVSAAKLQKIVLDLQLRIAELSHIVKICESYEQMNVSGDVSSARSPAASTIHIYEKDTKDPRIVDIMTAAAVIGTTTNSLYTSLRINQGVYRPRNQTRVFTTPFSKSYNPTKLPLLAPWLDDGATLEATTGQAYQAPLRRAPQATSRKDEDAPGVPARPKLTADRSRPVRGTAASSGKVPARRF